MQLKRVIPCLDVDAGRVVKGTRFVDIRDAGDPVELAAFYDRGGADELVFLDITATHEKRDTIVELARRTADDVFVPFTIGGGIRSVADAQAVLDAGADKVSVNSAAVARPELLDELAARFGAQCVVLAIDAKARPRRRLGRARARRAHRDRPRRRRVGARGRRARRRRDPADEHGPRRHERGLRPRADAARSPSAVGVPVIASGGAGTLEHLVEALAAGADAVLCASIFHYGQLHDRPGEGAPRSGRGRRPELTAMADARPARGPRRARALPAAAGGGRPRGRRRRVRPRRLAGARAARARPRRSRATRWRSRARSGGEVDRARAVRHGDRRAARAGASTSRWRAASATRRPGRCRSSSRRRIEEDLARRDFTVNAIAVTLDGRRCSRAERALEDLAARHACACSTTRSFVDDPTRLLRLARYAERLGLRGRAAHGARSPAAAGFETLSGARLGGELRLALRGARPGRRAGARRRPAADRASTATLLERGARARAARRRPGDARARRRGARGRAGSTRSS